jgi:hypothetical protein
MPAMEAAVSKVSEELKSHLQDAYELAVETAMRWVLDSRFEVESEEDEIMDRHLEGRMIEMIRKQIKHQVEPTVPEVVVAAVKSTEQSATEQILLSMNRFIDSIRDDVGWRPMYIAKWVLKWDEMKDEYDARDQRMSSAVG